MPTAAKFAAGLLLAGLAVYCSEVAKALMPGRDTFGPFSAVNSGIGFLCGWRIVGARAGRGLGAAISNGITGVAAALVCCLAVHAIDEMVERAFDRRYGAMLEAVAGAFELMAEYAILLVDAHMIAALLLGSVIAGLVTEGVERRWS